MINEMKLLSEKRIARWQLQEIQKVFDIINVDKSGEVTINDLALLIHVTGRGHTFEYEEIQEMFQHISLVCKPTICWEEFLNGNI